MSKVIRNLAVVATTKTSMSYRDSSNDVWFAHWAHTFANEIIAVAKVAVLDSQISTELKEEIINSIADYFYSKDPTDPKPIVYLAQEATEYCKKEYQTVTGSTAWLWEEQYGQLLIEGSLDAVFNCDPSPKMVPHEPYVSITDNIWDAFYGEENE